MTIRELQAAAKEANNGLPPATFQTLRYCFSSLKRGVDQNDKSLVSNGIWAVLYELCEYARVNGFDLQNLAEERIKKELTLAYLRKAREYGHP